MLDLPIRMTSGKAKDGLTANAMTVIKSKQWRKSIATHGNTRIFTLIRLVVSLTMLEGLDKKTRRKN